MKNSKTYVNQVTQNVCITGLMRLAIAFSALVFLSSTGCATQPKPAPKNDKLMYYIPPEQLWPEDFPTKPQVCGSPFTGRLISR